jgi:heat shock protein HspQ
VHVFMVFAVDPYSLRSMITGWYNRAKSPEARNARPFYHLFSAREPHAHDAEAPLP